MSFNPGEYVVYHTQGICKVSAIVEREICGKTEEYFELHPVYDESVCLFLPVKNSNITDKMRKVITKEEIDDVIKDSTAETDIWIENDNRRREKYREIIAEGDRKQLIRLIRTLYNRRKSLQGTTKKLHVADERVMKEAEKILHEEFAFVLGIEPAQVVPYIIKKIEK